MSINSKKENQKKSLLRALIFIFFFLGTLTSSFLIKEPIFIVNQTTSVPRGIYLIEKNTDLQMGDVLIINLPDEIQKLAYARKYVGKQSKLLKPLVAKEHDEICLTTQKKILVNGKDFGVVLERDSLGRDMPREISGCQKIQANEVAVASLKNKSFDSRYFGPILKEQIVGIAKPLWLWKATL